MSLFPRSSGILLHPTSLPGPYGIGDLGEWAYRWVDWLTQAGQSVWQVLPLGPTSYGDSPYQTLSAFAGNPNLISLDKLVEEGWLNRDDLNDAHFPNDYVDYGPVIAYHNQKLNVAFSRFQKNGSMSQKSAFEAWCAEQAYWLDDYSLFVALKDEHGGRPWVEWERDYALRDPAALQGARKQLAERIAERQFRQWVFYRQWLDLKRYANGKGVRLFGDIPIFVAHDSADVWANRDEYYLDAHGNPEVIAGVPPDYFSPTGQRWGNPLYKWDVQRAKGYDWWIKRVSAALDLVDYIRIDHFRGFEAYWEIPATEETAIHGKWVSGPGEAFFKALRDALGELPIIAEDLGVITQGVEKLRDTFNLPGMKVLQFAWSDPKNTFLPHQHVPNCVVYSGTHDNNTTVGWWQNEADDGTRHFISQYLHRDIQDIHWTLIQTGMGSVGHTFIAPLQDVLGLGAEARMNTPGQPAGNWAWRFRPEQLRDDLRDRLAYLTWLYMRKPDQQTKEYGDVAIRRES